jgi:hypothetical protein
MLPSRAVATIGEFLEVHARGAESLWDALQHQGSVKRLAIEEIATIAIASAGVDSRGISSRRSSPAPPTIAGHVKPDELGPRPSERSLSVSCARHVRRSGASNR